jgi:hypothetical protein
MKKILMIASAVLLAAAIAAAGFWGGITYQTNKASQVQANFLNARGGAPTGGGQFPGADPANGGQAPTGTRGFGGGTMGEVKSIDGNVLTLSTAQDVTTVNLSDATVIQKTGTGSTQDLQPGLRITVSGQKDSDGNIIAEQITILNANSADPAYPAPAGATPSNAQP